jgi:hypothetical protein
MKVNPVTIMPPRWVRINNSLVRSVTGYSLSVENRAGTPTEQFEIRSIKYSHVALIVILYFTTTFNIVVIYYWLIILIFQAIPKSLFDTMTLDVIYAS